MRCDLTGDFNCLNPPEFYQVRRPNTIKLHLDLAHERVAAVSGYATGAIFTSFGLVSASVPRDFLRIGK
jgi:hypothetical protein